jgi:hypothetical protein
VKRRNILATIPFLVLLAFAGCNDGINKTGQAPTPPKVSLGIMPDAFAQKFNESLPVVLEALLDNDAYSRMSLAKLYMINDHTLSKGNTNSVFKTVSGPRRTPVFGTAVIDGELTTVGVSLGDNGNEARQDFLLIATTMGHVLTGEQPQRIRKKMMRLLVTLVENPEQEVAEGIGNVLFTAILSRTGLAIQAEHKQ